MRNTSAKGSTIGTGAVIVLVAIVAYLAIGIVSSSSSYKGTTSYSNSSTTASTTSGGEGGGSSSTTTSTTSDSCPAGCPFFSPSYSDTSSLYFVQTGDSLYSISQAQGVSLASLEQVNMLTIGPNYIFPGQEIVIPQDSDPIAVGSGAYNNFDHLFLAGGAQYGLDPMILKSQAALESLFNATAVSPDDPCGTLSQGGIDAGHSYGVMQMTPACISWFARNSSGQVDLEMNPNAADWPNSAFNPVYNVVSAAQAWSSTLHQLQAKYPGCTFIQYTEMTLGSYNAGNGAISSCASYNTQAANYISAVLNWYSQFASQAGLTDPY